MDFRNEVWVTGTGDRVRVGDLKDGHLLNVHRYLVLRERESYRPWSNDSRWIEILEMEMKLRGLTPLDPDGEPAKPVAKPKKKDRVTPQLGQRKVILD